MEEWRPEDRANADPYADPRMRRSRRRFDYDRRLIPNAYLAELEPEGTELPDPVSGATGFSPGYPAWNLLYYVVLCSLDPERENLVVVETGTNRGLATIVIAQALKDLGARAVVETVERNPSFHDAARANVEAAGLSEFVRFHLGDSLGFLRDLVARVDQIDFALIDDDHSYEHVLEEVDIVCPKVAPHEGKLYFDNTSYGGVADALRDLQDKFGGNIVEFGNCSWWPPGNAIWQPAMR